jgi:alcohol dehydrogenase
MEAATIAGMAFGNADVGAVHCLSESIGGLYDHPHGLLNAQLLVPVFRYQFDAVKARLNGFLPGLNAHELLERLTLLIDALKIPAPATLGLPPESFPEIARLAQANNSNESNPLPMSASDYERILADALA